MKVKENHHMISSEFGLSAMYRNLKKSGAERVSDESVDELRIILEEIGVAIAKSAVKMSLYEGRKTVKAEDVRLAANNLSSGKLSEFEKQWLS
jgi:histone H3/H4